MRGDILDLGLTTCDHPIRHGFAPAIVSFGQTGLFDTTSSISLHMNSCTAAWVLEAAKRLEALGRLRSGWDSHGGLELSRDAKRLTLEVLAWLGTTDMPVPGVVLGSGGTVHLEWRAKGRELEVGLGEDAGIDYVKVSPQGGLEEGKAKSNLSGQVRALAQWLLRG